LSGVFVWSMDLDDFTGEFCEQGKFPFLINIKKELDKKDVEKEASDTGQTELSSIENKQISSFRVNHFCFAFDLVVIKFLTSWFLFEFS
jgi:hypothetical protein